MAPLSGCARTKSGIPLLDVRDERVGSAVGAERHRRLEADMTEAESLRMCWERAMLYASSRTTPLASVARNRLAPARRARRYVSTPTVRLARCWSEVMRPASESTWMWPSSRWGAGLRTRREHAETRTRCSRWSRDRRGRAERPQRSAPAGRWPLRARPPAANVLDTSCSNGRLIGEEEACGCVESQADDHEGSPAARRARLEARRDLALRRLGSVAARRAAA